MVRLSKNILDLSGGRLRRNKKRIILRQKGSGIIEINFDNSRFFNFFRMHYRKGLFLGLAVIIVAVSFFTLIRTRADIYKANLYASSCLGSWQNPTQAEGLPDVQEGGAYFTKDNSAYASENNLQIYCGGFKGDTPVDAVPKKFTLKLSWLVTANAITNTEDTNNQPVDNNTNQDQINPSSDVPSGDFITIPESTPNTPVENNINNSPTSFLSVPVALAQEISSSEGNNSSDNYNQDQIQVVTVPSDDLLEVLYTLDGTEWKSLGRVNAENWKDASFEINDPNINNWEDLSKIQISIQTLQTNGTPPVVYLDSAYLEVVYENITPIASPQDLPKIVLKDSANIDIVSGQTDFNTEDTPNFTIIDPELSKGDIQELIKNNEAEVISDPGGKLGQMVIDVNKDGNVDTSSEDINNSSNTNSIENGVDSIINNIVPKPSGGPSSKLNIFSPVLSFFKNNFSVEKALAVSGSRISDVTILDVNGNTSDIGVTLYSEVVDGVERQHIKIDKPGRQFKPGRYTLRVTLDTMEAAIVSEQDFSWGVLTINTDRSIYQMGDNAYIQMGVLNEYGHTICDAKLDLTVVSPSGDTYKLSTEDNSIIREEKCGPDNIISVPDYYAYFPNLNEIGTYQTSLSAETDNGTHVIHDSFNVSSNVFFDVERTAPTRINPAGIYPVNFNIKVKKDFQGTITETVPIDFGIISSEENTSFNNVEEYKDEKIISWNVDLKAGDETSLGYRFDAPDISPEIFLIGSLKFNQKQEVPDLNSAPVFQETRQWQIASDAICTASVSGGWRTAATWGGTCNGGTYPVAGDTVIINAGRVVTVGANDFADSVTINTPTTVATGLTVSDTFTLTLTSALTLSANSGSAAETVTINGTGKIIAGSVSVGATSSTGANLITGLTATVCSGAGGLTVNGNISIAGGTASTATGGITMGACSVSSTGNISVTGGTGGSGARTFSTTTGNVSATGTIGVTGGGTAGGAATLSTTSGTISSGGATTVTSGTIGTATLSATTGKLSAAGFNIVGGTVASLVTVTGAAGNITTTAGITFSGTLAQAKLTIANVAAFFDNAGTISAGGTISIGASVVTRFTGASYISGASYTIGGNVQVNSGTLALNGSSAFTISGTLTIADGATMTLGNYAYTQTGAVTIGSGGSGGTLNGGGSNTGAYTFANSITVNANSVFDLSVSTGAHALTLASAGAVTYTNNGTTFKMGTGAITVSGTGNFILTGNNAINLGGALTIPTNRAFINSNTNTVTIASISFSTPTAANSFTLNDGTTTVVSGTLAFASNTVGFDQTLTIGSSTGSASLTVNAITIAAGTGAGNSIINCAANNTGSLTVTTTIGITGNSTSTGKRSLSMGTCSLTVGGATTLTGGSNVTGLAEITSSSGIKTFNGLLTISGGSGNPSAQVVSTAVAGTMNINAGLTFTGTLLDTRLTTGAASIINFSGTLAGAGVLSLTTGTLFKTTGASTAINAAFTTWKDWEVVSGQTTLGAAQTVTGLQVDSGAVLTTSGAYLLTNTCASTGVDGFNIDGTYSGSGGVTLNTAGCTIDGHLGAALVSNTGPMTFTNDKTIASSATISFGAVAATNPINVTAGTVTNNGSFTIVSAGTGSGLTGLGGWTQGANSTLNTAGATTTALSITTFDASTNTNTVNYTASGAQTVKAVTYSTLGLSGSGSKTVTGVTTIGHDFNMSGSATATPVVTTVAGDINISGTAVMTTGATDVVTGALNIGSGSKLTMGNFALSIGGATSITGTLDTVTGNTGNRTFTGTVTVNNGGIWNLSVTNPAVFFQNGLTVNNTSTFTPGSGVYTFQTNAQILGGSKTITIGNVTNNVTTGNGLTLEDGDATITTLTQGSNAVLTFAGTIPTITTLTANTNPNTVVYAGGAQTVKNVTYHHLVINGSGTASLGNALVANGNLTVASGTLATANNTISAATFAVSGGTVTAGSSVISLTGTGTVFNYSSGAYTAGTSTIKLTDTSSSAKTFAGGGQTYGNIWITGTGTGDYIISGDNHFVDFKDDNSVAHNLKFTAGSTTTVASWTISGTSGNVITLKSTSDGNSWYLVDSDGGINNSDYLSIKDSHASGGTWNAGENCTDVSGNDGWTFFTPVYSVNISSNGTISYGVITLSNSKNTTASGLNTTPVATNDGNTTEKLSIKGVDTSCWTLFGSIATDKYVHEFSTNSGSSWTPLTTNYQTLTASMAKNATKSFDLRVTMPSASSCVTQQSPNATILATAP